MRSIRIIYFQKMDDYKAILRAFEDPLIEKRREVSKLLKKALK